MTADTKALKKKLTAPAKAANRPDYARGLSTGCTLLNLALTGRPHVGVTAGDYYLFVGGSGSGKTWICCTVLAEATLNKHYRDYRLIYNAPERGARMDARRYFGSEFLRRVEWRYPRTVEDFYYSLDDDKKAGRPYIQVLDSMDALEAEADVEHFGKKKRAAAANDKEAKGSYGTAKAKMNSSGIRHALLDLGETQSILLVISQTRQNIGFGSQYNPETRSGGTALRFYATNEVWFKKVQSIKRRVAGVERPIGSVLQARVKKNRDTGREWPVDLHHYPDVGFDDLGSLVAYLVAEGHWQQKAEGRQGFSPAAKVIAPEFGWEGSAEKLVQQLEADNKESELRQLAADVWERVEAACEVVRKPRYT